MSDTPQPLLAVNNIEVIYDHVILVLKGVSLAVPEGGIVALLGANGAGKSTTLKAISGLLRTERGDVTKGSIEFMGEGIRRKDPSEVVRRGIVQVMEGRHVFEHLTFMVGGALFWWPVVGATSAAARWRLGDVGRVLYLVFGTVPADTVAVILMFARGTFYPFYQQAPRLIPGIDPLTDQVLAGVVLMAVGKVSYLVAILDIFFRWLARARADEAAPEILAAP